MPVTHLFQGNVFCLKCVGYYGVQELKKTFLAGLADPQCPPHPALMFDVRASTSLTTRTSAEIQDVARFLGEHADAIGRRCAVLVTEDVHFGLIRMGSTYTQDTGVQTEIFRDMSEALTWLGTASNPDDTEPPRTG